MITPYLYVVTMYYFCFVQQHYFIIFVNLYDHAPLSITCINFILLNLLYLHIYMFTHPMYGIFVLFNDTIVFCIHSTPSIY